MSEIPWRSAYDGPPPLDADPDLVECGLEYLKTAIINATADRDSWRKYEPSEGDVLFPAMEYKRWEHLPGAGAVKKRLENIEKSARQFAAALRAADELAINAATQNLPPIYRREISRDLLHQDWPSGSYFISWIDDIADGSGSAAKSLFVPGGGTAKLLPTSAKRQMVGACLEVFDFYAPSEVKTRGENFRGFVDVVYEIATGEEGGCAGVTESLTKENHKRRAAYLDKIKSSEISDPEILHLKKRHGEIQMLLDPGCFLGEGLKDAERLQYRDELSAIEGDVEKIENRRKLAQTSR